VRSKNKNVLVEGREGIRKFTLEESDELENLNEVTEF